MKRGDYGGEQHPGTLGMVLMGSGGVGNGKIRAVVKDHSKLRIGL
jgi:hypothetical protein